MTDTLRDATDPSGDPDSDPHAWSGRVQRDWVDGGGP